jgi:hypothetical protein
MPLKAVSFLLHRAHRLTSVSVMLSFLQPGGETDSAYLVLHNDSLEAVDISGWSIGGDIEFTSQSGVVLSAGSDLFVAKNFSAFRSIAAELDIGENRFVQGG